MSRTGATHELYRPAGVLVIANFPVWGRSSDTDPFHAGGVMRPPEVIGARPLEPRLRQREEPENPNPRTRTGHRFGLKPLISKKRILTSAGHR